MVEPVQLGQPVRVGLLALQLVDQRDLPADQVLGTPADVAEHLRDVAPADHLTLDQSGGGVLHPLEGAGQVADLVVESNSSTSRRTGRRPRCRRRRPAAAPPRRPRPPARPSGSAGSAARPPPGATAATRISTASSTSSGERADPVRDGQRPPLLGDRRGDVVDETLLDEAAEDAERQQRPGTASTSGSAAIVLTGSASNFSVKPLPTRSWKAVATRAYSPLLVRGGEAGEPVEVGLVLDPFVAVPDGLARDVAGRHHGQQRGALGVGLVQPQQRVEGDELPSGVGGGVGLL